MSMKTKEGKPIDDDIVELAEGIATESTEEILMFGMPGNRIAYRVAQALQEERDRK